MITKNKFIKSNKPKVTDIHLQDSENTKPEKRKEPSIDLLVVFDENTNNSNNNVEQRKVIDLSSEKPEVKEHNYYKVLFESAIDGIIIIDAETMRITLANQIAADMYGFSEAEDLFGVNPLKLVHPDDKDKVLRIIVQDIIHNNLRLIHRFRGISKDGSNRWIRAVGSRTEYQGKLAALVSIRDITDQVNTEANKNGLEQRLEFASRMASVGELAAGLAYQLNDPLSAIIAYDQLLMEKKDIDGIVREGLEAIYRETQRAVTITDNLRHFANRHKPEKSLVSINDVIERAISLCAHRLKTNKIEILRDLKPDLPKIMADFQQVCQVFVNIINNADHSLAASQRDRQITITSQVDYNMIKITFTDNGPGIPKDDLPKIFDPFFTSDQSGKRTGLGLTVCYGLIEGHDGRIYADSTMNKSTTITVELPIAYEDALMVDKRTTSHVDVK